MKPTAILMLAAGTAAVLMAAPGGEAANPPTADTAAQKISENIKRVDGMLA